jgi:hypothetical protein
MFWRREIPVWIGIILLSGMVLMGQVSCGPTTGTFADVLYVSTSGTQRAYSFAVTVSSPDTGCNQYANWWEVLSPQGALLYRHTLSHSHVLEQPFTRQGGPVPVWSWQTVIVRAHMSNVGYGGVAMRGSVLSGFEPAADITEDFAPEVETQDPLPERCHF